MSLGDLHIGMWSLFNVQAWLPAHYYYYYYYFFFLGGGEGSVYEKFLLVTSHGMS